MKPKHLLLGFLTGASIVGLTTLLYAPSSGKELRKNIVNNKDEIQDMILEIKAKLTELGIEVSSASRISKETITLFIADVKESIQAWQTDIKPHTDEIHNHMAQIEQAVAELEDVVKPRTETITQS
ncbi:MAG: YtxH domain-containing protein [Bacillus sp. (in: firmicutes)]